MLGDSTKLLITIPLSCVKIIKSSDTSNCAPTPASSHSTNTHRHSKVTHSLPFPLAKGKSSSNTLHSSFNSQSETLKNLSPSLTLCGSDAEDILLVIDQAPKQSVHSIYTELNVDGLVETTKNINEPCSSNNCSFIHSTCENVAARKFASPPGANYKKTIKRHIRYKDQRKFPATKQFFEFLCFSREKRHEYPKAKKFLFSNVPF